MDGTVGQRTYAPRPQASFLQAQDQVVSAAEQTGREIDLAVRDLIAEGDAQARSILEGHRQDLEQGVALLIAKETLTADEFAALRPVAEKKQAQGLPVDPPVDFRAARPS
jgi:cell division protease FtsH